MIIKRVIIEPIPEKGVVKERLEVAGDIVQVDFAAAKVFKTQMVNGPIWSVLSPAKLM